MNDRNHLTLRLDCRTGMLKAPEADARVRRAAMPTRQLASTLIPSIRAILLAECGPSPPISWVPLALAMI